MYVLVRTDLSPAQIAVQAAHAAIEAARQFLPAQTDHPHLIMCAVKNQAELLKEKRRLDEVGIKSVVFYEEDRAGEATALGSQIVYDETRLFFRRYRLLKC